MTRRIRCPICNQKMNLMDADQHMRMHEIYEDETEEKKDATDQND